MFFGNFRKILRRPGCSAPRTPPRPRPRKVSPPNQNLGDAHRSTPLTLSWHPLKNIFCVKAWTTSQLLLYWHCFRNKQIRSFNFQWLAYSDLLRFHMANKFSRTFGVANKYWRPYDRIQEKHIRYQRYPLKKLLKLSNNIFIIFKVMLNLFE